MAPLRTDANKTTLVFFCILLISCTAFCQPLSERITLYQNGYVAYKNGAGDIKCTFYRDQVIQEKVYAEKGMLLEEYIKYSESCLLFIRYDTTRVEIQKGLVTTDKSVDSFASVFYTPDLAKDPDGSKGYVKDTASYSYGLAKTGYWTEKDSTGITWRGFYKNGRRNGKWEIGQLHSLGGYDGDAVFTINNIAIYDDGYLKNEPVTTVWPNIAGRWYINTNKSSDTIYFFTREDVLQNRHFIDFTSLQLYKYFCPITGELDARKLCNGEWQFNNGLLMLYKQQEVVNYRIVSLDEKELVLRMIK
jgi:hypothetical protein